MALAHWLGLHFNTTNIELIPLSGDAGFRCYYRFFHRNQSYIAVDAPDDYCNNLGFIEIAKYLSQQNINTPKIIAHQQGSFFCLSDLGDTMLCDVLTPENMESFYQKAIEQLINIAIAEEPVDYVLPDFNRDFILNELSIFTEWLLVEHLQITLLPQELKALHLCFEVLVQSILEQPQVTMHRDFHSRNIMLVDNESQPSSLAIIDFQDAVKGPVTYDLVSLLRDCYVRWPQQQIDPLIYHYHSAIGKQLNINIAIDDFIKWFDLTGIQRHLKAAGIFARLHHRDNKSGYLKDIPLTLSYIVDIAAKYPSLAFLSKLICDSVIPALEKQKALVTQ